MSFMPGMFPGAAAAAGALITLTQVLSATNTGTTIIVPANVRAGDLMVLVDAASSIGASPANVVPGGFTQISTGTGSSGITGLRTTTSYKIALGTEGGSTLTGMNGDVTDDKVLVVFRGNIQIRSVTPGSITTPTFTDGNPTAINVSAAGQPTPLIVIGTYTSFNTIDPRTMSPAKDGEVNSSVFCYLAWKFYNKNSTPATVSVDIDDEGNGNSVAGFYLLCS